MWIPSSTQDILNALQRGEIEETHLFEAKREPGQDTAEIAKDIASMANDGGVILYGIGETNNRLVQAVPLKLKGLAERIEQVAQTAISEPPQLTFRTYPLADEPETGFLLVIVPQSERAPHMVTKNNENRFYGRGDKTVHRLSEGEIARLYQRRIQWETDRSALLQKVIDRAPIARHYQHAHLYLFVKPVAQDESLLATLERNGSSPIPVVNQVLDEVPRRYSTFQTYWPCIQGTSQVRRRLHGYTWEISSSESDAEESKHRQFLSVECDLDGLGILDCGGLSAWPETTRPRMFFTDSALTMTLEFVGVMGEILQIAGYWGHVDIGVAVTDILGTMHHSEVLNVASFPRAPLMQENEYRFGGRFSMRDLLDNPVSVTRRLMERLAAAYMPRGVDLFSRLPYSHTD